MIDRKIWLQTPIVKRIMGLAASAGTQLCESHFPVPCILVRLPNSNAVALQYRRAGDLWAGRHESGLA